MTIPPPPTAPSPNPVVRALRAPLELRTWKDTAHLLLNLPVGIATFTIIVTGFALGFSLLITLVGIPILVALVYVSRWMGTFERVRAASSEPAAGEGFATRRIHGFSARTSIGL